MPPKKTPTSSLSVIELFAKRVWYRSHAGIQRIRSGGDFLEKPTTHAARLPLEIVETIVAYLIYDMPSLRACTLTGYSWYIAAVPHLHYNLFTNKDSWGRNFRWPNPLRCMHRLGLLPFVKTFYFYADDRRDAFSSKRFKHRTLHQFSALTSVRRLIIDYLDIPSFMPRIRRYFRQFLPTVRELCLDEPKGSRRQIIYFIGLFEHLEDLCLLYTGHSSGAEPADDPTLTPSFTPPLGGQLRLSYFRRVGLLKDMIDLFGGIRFSSMDLLDVDGMPLLLGACAETLETLLLYPSDPRATSSLTDFDLSQIKTLRTIQVEAQSIDRALSKGSLETASSILKQAISTVRSTSFSKIGVLYRYRDFCGVESWRHSDRPHLREVSEVEMTEEALRHSKRFEVLREVRNVRDFWLVLTACVWDPVGEYSVRMLKEAIADEKAKGGFDTFYYEPSVTYSPRRARS